MQWDERRVEHLSDAANFPSDNTVFKQGIYLDLNSGKKHVELTLTLLKSLKRMNGCRFVDI